MKYLKSALKGVLLVCGVIGALILGSAIEELHSAMSDPGVEQVLPPDGHIMFSPGGGLLDFVNAFNEARVKGTYFKIDGMCISACTMITGLIPRDHVCITPYAHLGFHSASVIGEFSPEGTRLLWHIYPNDVRTLLTTKYGWDGEGKTANHPTLIYVEGDDLKTLFQPCKDN